MRIGIDIDNTICKTNIMTKKIYKKYHNDNFESLTKIEQYEFSALHEKDIFDSCPLFNNVVKVINKLKSEGHKIFFITARCNKRVKNIENRTIYYLMNKGIKYDEIYFGYDDKYDIYMKLNLDLILDDDYDVYEKVIKHGGNAVLFSGNLNIDKKGTRVNNWKEFYNYVKKETR